MTSGRSTSQTVRGTGRMAVPESSTMARSSTPPRLEGVRHPWSRGSSARWSEVLCGDYLVSPATNSHIDLASARVCAREEAILDRFAPLYGQVVCTGMGINSRTAIRTGRRTGGQIEVPEP
jgi:hypothetical protein